MIEDIFRVVRHESAVFSWLWPGADPATRFGGRHPSPDARITLAVKKQPHDSAEVHYLVECHSSDKRGSRIRIGAIAAPRAEANNPAAPKIRLTSAGLMQVRCTSAS